MLISRNISLWFFIFLFSIAGVTQAKNSKKDLLVGATLKAYLEQYHYRRRPLDNNLSKEAFKLFIKKIDPRKEFLTLGDIKQLKQFESLLDDQMISGNISLAQKALDLKMARIKQLQKVYTAYFSTKKIKLNKKGTVEFDPEKRDYFTSDNDLSIHWNKSFQQSIVSNYLGLIEEQNGGKKSLMESKKKKNKKKKVKKKSMAQLRLDAIKDVKKKYKNLFERYLKDTVNDYKEYFYNAIANVYDPHTTYFPPKKKEDFDIDISGSLEGIGAVLQEDGGYIKVVNIVPGGAAWRQKELEADDLILKVEQKGKETVNLVGMRVDDAVQYIRGKKDTKVTLTVKKASGTRKKITIVRDMVRIGESYAKSSILQHKKQKVKVGYINLPKFYRDFGGDHGERNCSDDVRKEIKLLKQNGAKGIILDLRSNGGGALEDARQISGLFIKKGPIVQVRNQMGQVNVLRDDDNEILYDGPLVVMTGRFSASASEIVAGALQDYRRAVVVGGKQTHGKGTVQTILSLNKGPIMSMLEPQFNLGALKFTIQKFYRISGSSTQFKGITPDIIIPDRNSYIDQRENELDFSLPWDEISGQKFTIWDKPLNIPLLRKRSLARVKKNPRLIKEVKSLAYLTKRKKDTKLEIDLKSMRQMAKDNEKKVEELKFDKINKNILVSHYEASLKSSITIKKEDEKHWEKDFKERKTDWVEQLQRDGELEEGMNIIVDMVNMSNLIAGHGER